MDKGAAIALTALVGGAVAVQAPINSRLGDTVGDIQAALLSFTIGTALLVALTGVFGGGFGSLGEARELPWHYLLGGVLGVAYVSTVLITVRTLGAGALVAATISGQLTMSVVIDQLGILGVTKQPITATKVAGVVLLGLGTYLVVRD